MVRPAPACGERTAASSRHGRQRGLRGATDFRGPVLILDLTRSATLAAEAQEILGRLGVAPAALTGGRLPARSPITGERLADVQETASVPEAIGTAHAAFLAWRSVPAPRRGELVRLLGEELRAAKADLGRLVTLEAGKIGAEGLGEVQEMIDICDFATGLSRQIHGLTIATERPEHRMMETWHPLGVVGVISAFNFPVAVWSWNAALALVCGNAVVWKPSEKTPLTALAVQAIFEKAAARFGDAPDGLSTLLLGTRGAGEALVNDPRVPLVSATGSTAMGRAVAPRLAERFARAILELGGNNAAIVCPSADLDLTVRAVAFAAMGTAGQRCTTLRRLIVHDSLYDTLLARLKTAYGSVTVGDPRAEGTLVGPLIDRDAFRAMERALSSAKAAGGTITGGERIGTDAAPDAFYVRPALVEMPAQGEVVRTETFAPILYVMRYSKLKEAIALQNDVPQGLASAIFTGDLREAERFMSAVGSDCGIVNVNIGPSGAEIGGAFGGEKETGGGREAGSDSWKAYMRRATNTINYGNHLPLAQGVTFEVG
ncbi:MAG: aldehyde dehydrogenase family protein [Rhizobiales bacterium 32-66-8]|nr:MAG: aldehyde dehydrogenase family protein [Rhizobiales bacterium 32-66-8]